VLLLAGAAELLASGSFSWGLKLRPVVRLFCCLSLLGFLPLDGGSWDHYKSSALEALGGHPQGEGQRLFVVFGDVALAVDAVVCV